MKKTLKNSVFLTWLTSLNRKNFGKEKIFFDEIFSKNKLHIQVVKLYRLQKTTLLFNSLSAVEVFLIFLLISHKAKEFSDFARSEKLNTRHTIPKGQELVEIRLVDDPV